MEKVRHVASLYSELHNIIYRQLQDKVLKAPFSERTWKRKSGTGLTCVVQNSPVIEKGGVNFSFVEGRLTPEMENLLSEKAESYSVTGISSVMHPVNPYVPIIHMNIRYFALDNGARWFGGGIDLTPHFIDISEARSFHGKLKRICDKYDQSFYPGFKKNADDYFYIPHRKETRGIGGIFFDRLKPVRKMEFDRMLEFTLELGNSFPRIYSEIVENKSGNSYTEKDRRWQQLRRGRYVEFNLVYDRGTKFGFESSRNTESILISLPKNASWEYDYKPEINSPEYSTQQLLKKGIDWINF
jgi:coproporphyrinogen III oxidase